MLIRKILTQQIDKIGWENVTNCHILADCPNGTNYWVNKCALPSRCFLPISARYLLSEAFAVKCFFMSLTAAEVNESKARLRRATAMTTTARVGTPYIKISARRRRVDRAIQLLQPISPDGAFGQNVGRVGTPKMGRGKGVKNLNFQKQNDPAQAYNFLSSPAKHQNPKQKTAT